MASQEQIDATYNYMDRLFRLSLGDHADITGAMYDGDYRKSLEQAQQDKHNYILSNTCFRPGFRVLDIGCGWGGLLLTVRNRGGRAIGLTLSTRQVECCRRAGLDARLSDWKSASPAELGRFDTVVSVGAFEHFCSEEDFLEGKQNAIYRRFFEFCRAMLPAGARMFLQTMLWGPKAPPSERSSLDAPKGSDEYILGVLRKFYPGSWLPSGVEQIQESARPLFEIVSTKNGRADYIETMAQWSRRLNRFSFAKVLAAGPLAFHLLRDKDLRYKVESLLRSYNQKCFRRQIMDHERIVLEAV
jgi:cyclopropane-fatty-acyl-phospholipid synthase